MGMGVFGMSSCSCDNSCCSFDYTSKRKAVTSPDPTKFEILETYEHWGWCIARVRYTEATNYEGEKILMFNAPEKYVRTQTKLDPHFCEEDHLSPFARFEPTKHGWKMAKYLLHMMRSLGSSDRPPEWAFPR